MDRRRHSGPPPPLRYQAFHDDRDRDRDRDRDLHDNFGSSGGSSNVLHDRRYSVEPGPSPAHISFDTQRRPIVPFDHVVYSRGRRPTRQTAYSDLRGSGGHSANAISPPVDSYDDLPSARRRRPFRSHSPRYQERPRAHERHGPPGRSSSSHYSSEPRGSTSSPKRRSVSSASHDERREESAGKPWWQNPIVRACVVTAVSTGISAALDSRGDPGQWKGAKGAKVAVATIGSAVVDGFLGQKYPDGLRHKVMKKGVEVAMDEAEKKKKKHQVDDVVSEQGEEKRDDRRSRSTRRHVSSHHHDGARRHRSHDGGHRRRH
ncbi:hypothetical protein E4U21_004149 [Claviceps maximensis]|nr:hypothetical protein E4U21_004149 [Claviceps maximensis]